jgi:hypothetical protein
MAEAATMEMASVGLRASDVSGQKKVKATGVPAYTTVSELVQSLLQKLGLPRNDVSGRPLSYRARLEREARHLNPNERVGDAIKEDDELTLHPNVDAGGK